MKIAKVYPFPVPLGRNKPKLPGNVRIGGGETFPFNLALKLSDAGNDVTYFTGKLPGVIDEKSRVRGLKIEYHPFFMLGNLVHHAVSMRIFFRLFSGKYDVYTSWQVPTMLSVITGLAAKMRRKKFVVGHIGLRPEISRSARLYARIVSTLADKVIVPNRFSAQFIEPYFKKDKIVHMPYAIDLTKFKKIIDRRLERRFKKKGEKLVLFVGRLIPNKGTDILVRSIKDLRESGVKARLLLVGKGPMEDYLKRLSRSIGISDFVEFVGFVGDSELPKYYSICDVTVLPSVYKDSFGNKHPEPEAFGLVLAESISCGTPVVATRVGGIPTWIKDGYNGLLCRPGNHIELARKIKKVIGNNRLSSKLVRNGVKELKDKYSLDVICRRYTEIIKP